MITLDAEKIRDFRGCRYLYKAKHIDNIKQKQVYTGVNLLPSQYQEAVKKTIKFFYFEVMNGTIPSYKEVVKKFEKLWLKQKTVSEIINDENYPQKNIHYYTTEGTKVISSFYNSNYKNPGDVLLLSEDYHMPLNSDVLITGTIDLAIKKNNKIILPIYSTNGKTYFSEGSEGYYKAILDTIAATDKLSTSPNFTSIFCFKNGKITEDNIVIDKLKIRQLNDISLEMNECKRFLPNHNYYWCNKCNVSKICSKW